MGLDRRRRHRGIVLETNQSLNLSRLEPHLAAQLLAGCERLDPAGLTEAADLERMTREGMCFAASTDTAQAVYVVKIKNGTAWIDACKGTGLVNWSHVLFAVIEAQAKGCAAVGFQTSRAGLVRQAKKQGYAVTGWTLRKTLQ